MRILFLVVLILAGCASIDVDKVKKLIAEGRCTEALSVIGNPDISDSISDIGVKLLDKGIVYHDCYHDNDKAAAYFTLAARYGNNSARELLIIMGKPVPAADLAQQQAAQPGIMEAIGQGLNAAAGGLSEDVYRQQRGLPPAAPKPQANVSTCGYKSDGNYHCGSNCGYKSDAQYHCE